jgi:hypothetical protein
VAVKPNKADKANAGEANDVADKPYTPDELMVDETNKAIPPNEANKANGANCQ